MKLEDITPATQSTALQNLLMDIMFTPRKDLSFSMLHEANLSDIREFKFALGALMDRFDTSSWPHWKVGQYIDNQVNEWKEDHNFHYYSEVKPVNNHYHDKIMKQSEARNAD